MATISRFLGQEMELPEDRLYSGEHHLWLRRIDDGEFAGTVELGLTQPGVALVGGFVDVEPLTEAGDQVDYDTELYFGTTGKAMKYVLSPFPGVVRGVNAVEAEAINGDPYGTWLVRIEADPTWEGCLEDADGYVNRLSRSEHATEEAAQARGGRGSPTCKSLYGGIRGS